MKKEEKNMEDYKMVRGPRPWEAPSEEFMKQQEELKERNKIRRVKTPRELGLM